MRGVKKIKSRKEKPVLRERFRPTIPFNSQNFDSAIEPKVRELVIALNEEGYVTVSSCEGHDLLQSRVASVVFPSKNLAKDFCYKIDSGKLKHAYCSVIPDEIFFNMKEPSNQITKVPRKQLTDWLTRLTGVHSDAYYVAEISIAGINAEETSSILELFLKIRKKFLWDYWTKKVVRLIKKED